MDLLIITLFVGFAHYTLTEKWKVPYLSCFWCFSFWFSMLCYCLMYYKLDSFTFIPNIIIKAGACTYLGSLINLWRINY